MYYLVDYENTSDSGLEGIDSLGKKDTVALFFGVTQASVSVKTVGKITGGKARIEVFCMERGGKNYLDMQMAIHLGTVLARKPSAEAVIISKDKGFTAPMDYAAKQGRTVSAFPSIREALDARSVETSDSKD